MRPPADMRDEEFRLAEGETEGLLSGKLIYSTRTTHRM
jgi:hypothetical protein